MISKNLKIFIEKNFMLISPENFKLQQFKQSQNFLEKIQDKNSFRYFSDIVRI